MTVQAAGQAETVAAAPVMPPPIRSDNVSCRPKPVVGSSHNRNPRSTPPPIAVVARTVTASSWKIRITAATMAATAATAKFL